VLQANRSKRRRLLLLLVPLALVVAACSSGSDDTNAGGNDASTANEGGSLIDVGTFAGGPPDTLDPALNNTVEYYSVINALYDGLTDLDYSDPKNVTVKPLVAESYEVSDDGLTWTFKIRKGAVFSSGEKVLPSSFVRGWLRASDSKLAGPNSNLFALIDGGQERLDGKADDLRGVKADDEARTLTVKLVKPYANFAVLAGFQVFYPMPKEVEQLSDQSKWDQGVMIGNGPFKLASARTDREVVLVRNDRWGGGVDGTRRAKLDKITFQVTESVDSAYDALDGADADSGPVPPNRVAEVRQRFGHTLDTTVLSSIMLQVAWHDPVLGGPKNAKLRQAISLALDRDEINRGAYSGSLVPATGITPPGIPGYKAKLCDFCRHDVAAAKKALADWKAAGNELKAPLKLQVNDDFGHGPAFQIMVDNLKEVGIPAQADVRPIASYKDLLGNGGCQICRWNWIADYPTYDNFLFPNFHSSQAGGPGNWGSFEDPRFDTLVDDARSAADPEDGAGLFNQAEERLLNEDVATIPVFWGRGNYAYDKTKVGHFVETNLGLVLWEEVTKKG
jgi:ABC-type transport system substrate-binding protein